MSSPARNALFRNTHHPAQDAQRPSLWFALFHCMLTATAFSQPASRDTHPRQPSRLVIRWIGQDGHDFVSPSNRHEPSEVQDIHLRISNLDPRREIDFVDLIGHGGDQWQYGSDSLCWKIELKRSPQSTVADLFIEPNRPEKSRNFHIKMRYTDGMVIESDFRGGSSNPYLRMPAVAVSAHWVGQDGQDWTGLTPSVGPDGFKDVRIQIQGLSVKIPIKGIRLELPNKRRWEFGTNPKAYNSAELHQDKVDRSGGNLFFQPDQDLAGQPIELTIRYDNEKLDRTVIKAEPCNPNQPIDHPALPAFENVNSITARWIGQDATEPARPADLHVRLNGLPQDRPVSAALLSDSDGTFWVHKSSDLASLPRDWQQKSLMWRQSPDKSEADLVFEPDQDPNGQLLTLRLIFADGKSTVVTFTGGPCDLSKKGPQPDSTKALAKPGDDLQALLDTHGTVTLSPGTYFLSKPLILSRPATLMAQPGAILRFSQPSSEPAWTTAIKIHCTNTTLQGFKVRFDTPVRWKSDISYGPAVIGLTDPLDTSHFEAKTNIRILDLDIEAPPLPPQSGWSEAIRLMRLVRGNSGIVASNKLRGGPIEFFRGPWLFEDNEYLGCLPNTTSHAVVTWHDPRHVIVRNNTTHNQGPSGKTWRFLVFTGHGSHELVENNHIEDIGSRDDDTAPWSSEPEVMLTEAYHLDYEGIVLDLSPDGRVLRTAPSQTETARTGTVVSLLTGPAAGQFRRIVQPLDATAYLVDQPIPADTTTIAISHGFVGQTYRNNVVDLRGGQRSICLVLAANHFGTQVIGNRFLGGIEGISTLAYATEGPNIWGWSHTPSMGVQITDNVIEDCETGALIGVYHSSYTKTNRARTYQSVTLKHNTFRWTESYLAHRRRMGKKDLPSALTLGYLPSLDPNELFVDADQNHLDAPSLVSKAPSLWIRAARYNSQSILDRHFALPAITASSIDRQQSSASSSVP